MSITALVTAFSNDVVAALAAASLPPLSDGKILLGKQRLAEHSDAPRVVFVPTGWTPMPKSTSTRSPVSTLGESTEERAVRSNRAIANKRHHFDVYVWGRATPTDPAVDRDNDYDATDVMCDQIHRTAHALSVGRYAVGEATWTDDTQHAVTGRQCVFGLEIEVPILDQLLPYVPNGTVASTTVKFQPPSGSTPNPSDAVVVNG